MYVYSVTTVISPPTSTQNSTSFVGSTDWINPMRDKTVKAVIDILAHGVASVTRRGGRVEARFGMRQKEDVNRPMY